MPHAPVTLSCAPERDENGDNFHTWLHKRTFALLGPVCRLALVVASLFLLVADPLIFMLDAWGKGVAHAHLVAWHATAVAFFAGALWLHGRLGTLAAQQRLLKGFVLAVAALFVWFGVLSWLGTGDLSMVAVAQVLVASALCMPGTLRRWTYALQALVISALLAWLDRSGAFIGHAHFVNLLAAAAVAYAMDGYMLQNAHALFAEKCRVAQERQRADTVLYNTLPAQIAQELKSHGSVRAQSYPAMAILFADIAGFTAFAAQRAPDQVLTMLDQLFGALDALTDKPQLEKIKTMGDAYLVISKTHPQALAHLALAMCETMRAFNQRLGLQLDLRVGLHCGPAIAGVIGHKRLMYDVWGDAVNLASRMQSSSVPGRIHASQSMYIHLRDAFDLEPRGLVHIKGKGLVPGYFLLGAKAPAAAAAKAAGPVA